MKYKYQSLILYAIYYNYKKELTRLILESKLSWVCIQSNSIARAPTQSGINFVVKYSAVAQPKNNVIKKIEC